MSWIDAPACVGQAPTEKMNVVGKICVGHSSWLIPSPLYSLPPVWRSMGPKINRCIHVCLYKIEPRASGGYSILQGWNYSSLVPNGFIYFGKHMTVVFTRWSGNALSVFLASICIAWAHMIYKKVKKPLARNGIKTFFSLDMTFLSSVGPPHLRTKPKCRIKTCLVSCC